MHLYWAKKLQSPIFRILKAFVAKFQLFVQDKPFTKRICFQNLMIVFEIVYGEQMIVNGYF